jgi:hypothetical protein
MAKKGRAGNSYKLQYKAYKAESRFIKNKKAKLERHCLAHPTDETAAKVLDLGTWTYKRNRRSEGHTCKEEKSHVFKNPIPNKPKSTAEQLVALGIAHEKKYRRPTKRRRQRVL